MRRSLHIDQTQDSQRDPEGPHHAKGLFAGGSAWATIIAVASSDCESGMPVVSTSISTRKDNPIGTRRAFAGPSITLGPGSVLIGESLTTLVLGLPSLENPENCTLSEVCSMYTNTGREPLLVTWNTSRTVVTAFLFRIECDLKYAL